MTCCWMPVSGGSLAGLLDFAIVTSFVRKLDQESSNLPASYGSNDSAAGNTEVTQQIQCEEHDAAGGPQPECLSNKAAYDAAGNAAHKGPNTAADCSALFSHCYSLRHQVSLS